MRKSLLFLAVFLTFPAAASAAPTARFSFSPSSSVTGRAVAFDASASTCDDRPCTYAWQEDNSGRILGSGVTLSYAFKTVGGKLVRLTVTNEQGESSSVRHGLDVAEGSAPPPADSDGDGVPDSSDKCPGTPDGTTVDSSGCALVTPPADSDGDGVPNASDKCPGTPAGTTVDATGCAVVVPPPPSGGACPTSTPNVPDGPDGDGGCFPGPSTTGVPAGTALTTYSGPMTITAANTVIDAKTINGTLTIATTGVRITRSKINGSVWIDDPNKGYSFTISDTEIDAGLTQSAINDGTTAIGKSGFVATRVNTHGGIRGVWCEYNCTLQDSWIHDQAIDTGGHAHESGVRMGSGAKQVIRHNSLRCDAPNVPPDAGCSADLTGYGDFAPIQNNTIDSNLFLATTGGTCAYGGSSGDDGSKPYGNQANHQVFTNNVFQRRSVFQLSGKCGYWFAISDFDSSRPGNAWSGNTWDDGSTLRADG